MKYTKAKQIIKLPINLFSGRKKLINNEIKDKKIIPKIPQSSNFTLFI